MDFIEYLHSKKIDSDAFKKGSQDQWYNWKDIFDQVHPKSFTAQKLYLINPLRLLYPFEQEVEAKINKEHKRKPMMMPKVKAEDSTRPVVNTKPLMKLKIQPKSDQEDSSAEPKKEKPKFKPKPIIKKRPKTD